MKKPIRSIFDYIVSRLMIVMTVLVLAVVVDLITPLKQLDAYFKEYSQPYTAIALGMLIVGFALLWYPWGVAIFGRGQPMSKEKTHTSQQMGLFRGKAIGREARMTASFREIKVAFRTGGWLLDSKWRPICFGVIGALLALLGMFGYFFVIGPPTVKVIVGGALAYALARTAWGFWRA
jgi:type VI protein secretion system component VasK